ncbi:MAG TPA: hypothetical protein VEB20_19565 [Azospirillaceae bacterium]|nr:hypothetical protein [Azospirillaceae bacterium]
MRKRGTLIIAGAAAALLLSACGNTMEERAGTGALAGAGVGAATTGSVGGTLAGAAIGAGAGAVVNEVKDD